MHAQKSIWEVLKSDVLIIGGGREWRLRDTGR